MSDKTEHVPEEKLMIQLGSDQSDLMHGAVDMRRMTVLEDERDVVFHSIIPQIPNEEGGLFWQNLDVLMRNLKVAKSGRARTDVKQAIGGRTGTSVGVEVAEKPGWIARNVTQRDWKDKAEREGKVVEK